mgnify:CR=1 FL=1
MHLKIQGHAVLLTVRELIFAVTVRKEFILTILTDGRFTFGVTLKALKTQLKKTEEECLLRVTTADVCLNATMMLLTIKAYLLISQAVPPVLTTLQAVQPNL